MKTHRFLLLLAVLTTIGTATAQTNEREPRAGYVYPAGGRQGTTFEVTVGGQRMAGVSGAVVSGQGIHVAVVKWYRPLRKLDGDERNLLQKRIRERRDQLLAEAGLKPGSGDRTDFLAPRPFSRGPKQGNGGKAGKGNKFLLPKPEIPRPVEAPQPEAADGGGPTKAKTKTDDQAAKESPKVRAKRSEAKPGEKPSADKPAEVVLPPHPLFDKIDQMNLRQLDCLAKEFLGFRPKQLNLQIAELVVLRVTIDAGAEPGDRELRLVTPAGLTNPICFQVGVVPEACEQEPNDPGVVPIGPDDPPAAVPVVFNGQIRPGDIDRFRFTARRGQRLVLSGQARRLIPYLADAVPGWFQATLALYDEKGKELAFADDYTFDPDPVLFFDVPQDGVYQIQIHDSIFRGREDFVYRLTIGQQPFVRKMFPLGGPAGQAVVASIDGWNLPSKTLSLDTRPEGSPRRTARLREGDWVSDPVAYGVSRLPEVVETTPDTTTAKPQPVTLPCVVNGRIGRPGDVDGFQFEGKAGQEVVVEVQARCYRSPLDSLIRLVDAQGKAIAMNDDCESKESGLETHHADSYLRVRLPADGPYRVRLSDAQNHGGDDFAYRLRLGPPQPDFVLRATPSSMSVAAGQNAAITFYAVRKDGFDGPIDLALGTGTTGFVLTGGRIPAGQDRVQATLAAPAVAPPQPVALCLEGHARIGDQEVVRSVEPAEDRMQAFIYRHLTPAQQLLVAVQPGKKWVPAITVAGGSMVRIPSGGTAEIDLQMPRWIAERGGSVRLVDPPEGLSVGSTRKSTQGLAVTLAADAKTVKAGTSGNLLFEVSGETPPTTAKTKGKAVQSNRRLSLGILPAVPFEILPAPAPASGKGS